MVFDKSEYTTIWVKKTTHEKLTDIGKKPQSYDDIIIMLIDDYEKGIKNPKVVQKVSTRSGVKPTGLY